MKVFGKTGTRKCWAEMDTESRRRVFGGTTGRGKRGVAIDGKRHKRCNLIVRYGDNIHNTQIEIVEYSGLVLAFYSNGCFYDSILRQQVELF